MVGYRHHDHGRLRRHGSQDLPRYVRRISMRAHWRADDSASGSGDRVQLRAVLLTHAGASQAAQEATTGAASRGGPAQDRGAAGCTEELPRSGSSRRTTSTNGNATTVHAN